MMHRETFARGFGKLLRLGSAILVFGASVDTVKDLLRLKPVDEEDIAANVLDNFLQYMFMSTYTWKRIREDGLKGFLDSALMPPTRFADAGVKGVFSGDFSQFVRNVPVVGEPVYWWFIKD